MMSVKRNLDKVVKRTLEDKIIRDSKAQITKVTKLSTEAVHGGEVGQAQKLGQGRVFSNRENECPAEKMFSINNIEGRSKRVIFVSDDHSISGVEK